MNDFNKIGFNTKYISFNDILDGSITLWCEWNYERNYQKFFELWNRLMAKSFNITFIYGNVIKGMFVENCMVHSSLVQFKPVFKKESPYVIEESAIFRNTIIEGKVFWKSLERYRITDKDGNLICGMTTEIPDEFFQHEDVKVYLRQYKLKKLRNLFSDET